MTVLTFSALSGIGNERLLIDGHDVTRYVRSIEVSAQVGEVSRAAISLMLRDGFDVQLPADVTVQIVAIPGYVLVEEAIDGGRRWRCERPSEVSQ